jgi:steroid delta-isomerase-like uncharacterized protein
MNNKVSRAVELKNIGRRYIFEIMNQGNMATLEEIIADEFVFTLPTHPDPYRGPEGFKVLVNMLHGAFPDFFIHPREMVAEEDHVVIYWRGGGTHLGEPLHTQKGDVEASGNYFEIDGMSMLRISGDKIVEVKANEDTVGLLMDLGVVPGPPKNYPTREEAVTLVERYFQEIMTEGKVDVIPEILDENFTFHIPTQPKPFVGFEGFTGFVHYLRNAFPDIKFTPENHVVENNKVATRWNISGTHKGEFLGAPATGNKISDYGIDVFYIVDGKILSIIVNENDFGLMQQIGLIPA